MAVLPELDLGTDPSASALFRLSAHELASSLAEVAGSWNLRQICPKSSCALQFGPFGLDALPNTAFPRQKRAAATDSTTSTFVWMHLPFGILPRLTRSNPFLCNRFILRNCAQTERLPIFIQKYGLFGSPRSSLMSPRALEYCRRCFCAGSCFLRLWLRLVRVGFVRTA